MKFVSSGDWRDAVPFESPMVLADVVPGEDASCFSCGRTAEPRPRTELWAFKHRHPNDHFGYVRFYCQAHVPAVQRRPEPTTPASARTARAARAERVPAPRRTPAAIEQDKPRAMCPNCYVEVSATGECGMCGTIVA